MSFLTLGEAKETIATAVGMCSTDSRIVSLINQAQERLLNRENLPVGALSRYRFCVNESCIVLPREIRTVERFAICETPGEVYPQWHEFLGNGTHLYDEDDTPARMMTDHGRVATFNSVDPGQSVTSIPVSGGGSGYTSAPTVVITNDSDDTTGAGATATATISAGAVTGVTVTNSGSGYTDEPTISFTGGGGAGATATSTIGFNRKIRLLSSVVNGSPTDVGKVVTIFGYDENGQWIRSNTGSAWIDGEQVTLAATAVNTTNTFTAVTRVIKPLTEGRVDMWTWDSTASIEQRQLGAYQPSEKIPTYRRMFIPGIQNFGSCSTGCTDKSVTVLARLRHVPVSVDNDFLVLDNLGALKTMVMSIRREDQNRLDEAEYFERKALREIEGELAAHTGDGSTVEIRHAGSDVAGANVFNVI